MHALIVSNHVCSTQRIVMSTSVCVCVCLSVREKYSVNETYVKEIYRVKVRLHTVGEV